MSLVVWLPLTKDLRNQGLATITSTGTPVFKNSGKLGNQSLDLNTRITFNCPAMANKSTFSVAFWAKVNTDTSLTTNWVDVIGFTDQTSGGSNGQLRWETCYASGSETRGISSHDNATNATSNSFGSIIGTTKGIWYHIACTVDIDNNVINEYRNGEVVHTITPNGGHLTGAFWIGETGKINGEIQDVRIYDHALSQMEVKKLAKGLVLHYPLNRQGWGQENLMRNTYRADGNNSNQVYGWMANGNGNPEIVTKDGNECIHLQANCTGAYTPSIVSASKLLLENGVDYIVSCDLMYDKEIKVQNTIPVHYHNGSTSSTDPFNLTNVNNGKGFVWKSVKPVANTIIPANTWQHYEMRLTAVATPTDSSLPYSTYRAFIYGAVRTTSETATVNMWLKNWKIEKGTVATPWCPNSADTLATTMGLNSTTEYDCSGFCNNGSKMTDTITYTSDTAKYAVSTHFNGTYDGIIIENLALKDMINSAITYAFWIKPESESGARSIYFGSYSGISWSIEKTAGNQLRLYWNGSPDETCSGAIITDGVWQHICITKNGANDVKVYINGIQKWTSTATHSSLNFPTTYRIGRDTRNNDGTPYKGLMSDFRIYATALSASDVKSLYQNCATIDPDGTIRGQIRS